MTNPTVAVIIASYNAEKTIGRAIESAYSEPQVTQIFVIDDASTDQSVQVAQSYDDGSGRLHIIKQGKNAGPSAARNVALSHAKADWVTVLDSDDFFLKGRIAGLLSYSNNAQMVADDMWQVLETDMDAPYRALLGEGEALPRDVSLTDFVLSNVTTKGKERKELGFIKPLIRRDFLEQNNILYAENMRLGEDYELYTRALACGARLVLIPAQGYVSVVRANSLSGRHSEHDLLGLRDCNTKLLRDFPNLKADEKAALDRHYRDTDCRLQWRLLILAVKHKDPKAIIKTFLRPWPVPLYLVHKLLEQVWLRGMSKLMPQKAD